MKAMKEERALERRTVYLPGYVHLFSMTSGLMETCRFHLMLVHQ